MVPLQLLRIRAQLPWQPVPAACGPDASMAARGCGTIPFMSLVREVDCKVVISMW